MVIKDDVDGSEAAETLTFGIDGATYDIDLNSEHADELREQIGYWKKFARRHTGRAATSKTRPVRRGRSEASAIRQWALANGVSIGPRGRIPNELVERYRAERQAAAASA